MVIFLSKISLFAVIFGLGFTACAEASSAPKFYPINRDVVVRSAKPARAFAPAAKAEKMLRMPSRPYVREAAKAPEVALAANLAPVEGDSIEALRAKQILGIFTAQ